MPTTIRDREPDDFKNGNTPKAHYEIRYDSLNLDRATPQNFPIARSEFVDISREPRFMHGVNGGSRRSTTERVTLNPKSLARMGIVSFSAQDRQNGQATLDVETEITIVVNERAQTVTIDPQDPDNPSLARTLDHNRFSNWSLNKKPNTS